MYSSLVRHIHRFQELNYVSLSSHPYVTLVTLKKYNDKSWNWNLLTSHVNWNWNWVREFPEKPWNWRTISSSVYFTWDWVREFPEKPWFWSTLSEKADSIQTVKEFQDKPWNWYTLTLGNAITIEDMVENPNFPWTINQLLFTDIDDDITLKFLRYYRSHYDLDAWCDHTARTPWKIIKMNKDLPWVYWFVKFESGEKDVKLSHHHQWNWKHLSEMLDFKSVISKHMDLPWDFECMSKNRTVSYKDVLKYPEYPWNYNYIHLNDEALEWDAANTIKRYWKRSVTDPSFSLCRKIVLGDLFGALHSRNHPCDDECED